MFLSDFPGLQTCNIKVEVDYLGTHFLQALSEHVLSGEVAVEEHVATATGARYLPSDGTVLSRSLVELVDLGRADLIREQLLAHPRLVQESPELQQPTLL